MVTPDPRARTVEKLLDRTKLSLRWLGQRVGATHVSIGKWLGGEAKPRDESVWQRMIDALRQYEIDAASQAEEPPNIIAKRPEDLNRTERLLQEWTYVALPVWRGIVAGDEEECFFVEPDSPEFREIPYFLTMGKPELHVICVASGMSMAPRISHTERALIRLDPDVPPGHIVVARNDSGRGFIKQLARHEVKLQLNSLNPDFKPIVDLTGWTIKGGVVAILHAYEGGRPNIEWDEGRFLR